MCRSFAFCFPDSLGNEGRLCSSVTLNRLRLLKMVLAEWLATNDDEVRNFSPGFEPRKFQVQFLILTDIARNSAIPTVQSRSQFPYYRNTKQLAIPQYKPYKPLYHTNHSIQSYGV